jgi:membrane-associated protease RseP (regulator of RpoE activity)
MTTRKPAWPRSTFRVLTLTSALGLALASGAGFGLHPNLAPGGVEPQVLPLERTRDAAKTKGVVAFSMLPSNHMLVEATINGKGPYRLIFDLGAPITLLSNRAGETSGVVKPDAPRSFLFSMRGEAEVAKLEVGELTATKLPVVVFDHPTLKLLGDELGRPIDGIIGFTFFARYKTTIDYQASQMIFEPVEFQVHDLLKELPDRLMGAKTPRRRVLAPTGLWGLRLGAPVGGVESPGVPVADVMPGSPAAAAGLKPGDVLTTLNGYWTVSAVDVYTAAADAEPGRDVPVVILRDGKEQTLTVKPVEGI